MIIYKVTNKINGMIYIGKTRYSLQKRWHEHCRNALKNVKWQMFRLQEAIRQYGPENFTVEQIDCAATNDEANEKEVYWISFYNATEKGYNVSPGGRAGGNRKKVMSVEDGLVFDTMVEAANHYGLSKSMIPAIVDKPHLRAGGQHWISVKKDGN